MYVSGWVCRQCIIRRWKTGSQWDELPQTDGINANSALIVTVTPEDFGGNSPLSGISYQRKLEEAAYLRGNGNIPVQLMEILKEMKFLRNLEM